MLFKSLRKILNRRIDLQNKEYLNLERKKIISIFQTLLNYDEDIKGHNERLVKYSKFLGELVCLNELEINEISEVIVLHDIGMLSSNQIESEKKHCEIGAGIIRKASLGKIAENIVFYHHENWDGSGYPKGLKGRNIPIEARIVSLAKDYDLLLQKHQNNKSHQEILEIISEDSGIKFDPDLVGLLKIYSDDFEKICMISN